MEREREMKKEREKEREIGKILILTLVAKIGG
jgi:hypothetical protein